MNCLSIEKRTQVVFALIEGKSKVAHYPTLPSVALASDVEDNHIVRRRGAWLVIA